MESTPALNDWLNNHPEPEADAPSLWCHLQNGRQAFSYKYIREKLLGRAKERADIDKPVIPHHFRHSRATELAQQFKEAQLWKWFGCEQGSDVSSKYVDLSGHDIDDAYNELHGLTPQELEEAERTVRECPRCEELNERAERFSSRRGQAFEIEATMEMETAENKTAEQADDETLHLAVDLVQAMKNNPQEGEEFVEELTG